MDPTARDTLYTETAYYRMIFRERAHDVPLYVRFTEGLADDAEVLELGCGEGRMAAALAENGRRVLGVDASAPMLEALDERLAKTPAAVRARIHTERADARTLRLDRTFSHVICPFNVLGHFHDAEALRELLATVKAHLAPGGRFAFDVMIPDPRLLAGGASSVPRLEHPRTGAVCRLEELYEYDAVRQVLTVTSHLVERETGERQTLTLLLRQLFPQETLLLLEHHGFVVQERSEALGDSLFYVCRPR